MTATERVPVAVGQVRQCYPGPCTVTAVGRRHVLFDIDGREWCRELRIVESWPIVVPLPEPVEQVLWHNAEGNTWHAGPWYLRDRGYRCLITPLEALE